MYIPSIVPYKSITKSIISQLFYKSCKIFHVCFPILAEFAQKWTIAKPYISTNISN